jgi:BMFP domain-containing protein YqiC
MAILSGEELDAIVRGITDAVLRNVRRELAPLIAKVERLEASDARERDLLDQITILQRRVAELESRGAPTALSEGDSAA